MQICFFMHGVYNWIEKKRETCIIYQVYNLTEHIMAALCFRILSCYSFVLYKQPTTCPYEIQVKGIFSPKHKLFSQALSIFASAAPQAHHSE